MEKTLGRGLDALLKRDVDLKEGEGDTERKVKLNKDLLSIDNEIEKREEKAEKLRQYLTVDLMLGKDIDKSELIKMENEIRSLRDKRSIMKAELEILTKGDAGASDSDLPEGIEESEEIQTRKSDIDMRMVRELMSGEEEAEVEWYEDEEVGEEYLDRLRMENHPRSKLEAVKKESMGSTVKKIKPKIVRRKLIKTPVKSEKRQPLKIRRAKMVRDSPGYRKTVNNVITKANKLMERGRIDEGLEILEHANSVHPGDGEIQYHLGNAYFLLGEMDLSYKWLKMAVKRNKENFRAYNNIGVILQKTGHLEEGIRALNHALEIYSDYERAWYNLGSIFMELDPPMLKEATVFLRRALELDPDYIKAKEKLKKCRALLEKG